MTYCLANRIDHGLVFVSDSGTNAGADQISAHSRMHRFGGNGERTFTLLSAGDLATTQGVVAAIRRDIRRNAKANLMNIEDLPAAAEHVGRTSIREQAKHRGARLDKEFLPAARPTSDRSARQATSCAATPFLQIGEGKRSTACRFRTASSPGNLPGRGAEAHPRARGFHHAQQRGTGRAASGMPRPTRRHVLSRSLSSARRVRYAPAAPATDMVGQHPGGIRQPAQRHRDVRPCRQGKPPQTTAVSVRSLDDYGR